MRILAYLLILLTASLPAACSRSVHQQDFASADDAVNALLAAMRSGETSALLKVLGPEAQPTIESGDPVQDKNVHERFLHAYDESHAMANSETGVTTLEVGADKWPFPFPLVQRDGRWRFDSAAGNEEIVNRRVGDNELSTIQSCLAFVDAQREYYMRNATHDPLQHYARKLLSNEGEKDGLYWPTAEGEQPSPLGGSFARARAEGYFKEGAANPAPFHGYYFQLLTAQGPNAAGGAYDYLAGDKLLGGFALIAFPAEYGNSGVMTFMVNHDGIVFSKDLGPETAKEAAAIKTFDPDSSWKREATIE
ncbi:MAG: DUF2950 domain-containing protein [Povalibacter sp.]